MIIQMEKGAESWQSEVWRMMILESRPRRPYAYFTILGG